MNRYFSLTHLAWAALLSLFLFASTLFPSSAHAAAITMDLQRVLTFPETTRGIDGLMYDPVTGKYYVRRNWFNSTHMTEYANADNFANGVNGVVTTGPSFSGTYAAVENGIVYARSDRTTPQYGRWDLGSGGALVTSVAMPEFDGSNGNPGTFAWGGFSGLNTMRGGNGLYIVGGAASRDGTWTVRRITDQNTLSTEFVANLGPSPFGFGFIVGDQLFMGRDFQSAGIDLQVDLTTGVSSAVSHSLAGLDLTNSQWISNTFYDTLTDSLFVLQNGSNVGRLSRSTGIAQALGLTPVVVSEGSALSLLGLAVLLLFWTRRRLAG